jgi:hypothetical protein
MSIAGSPILTYPARARLFQHPVCKAYCHGASVQSPLVTMLLYPVTFQLPHRHTAVTFTPFHRQVERALSKIGEVCSSMVVLLVVEGCLLFTAAALYVCLLVRKVRRICLDSKAGILLRAQPIRRPYCSLQSGLLFTAAAMYVCSCAR